MEARELIDELRDGGAEIQVADGGYIEVAGDLTDVQRKAIRAYKPELLRLLGREHRRRQVLQMMDEDDQRRKYYWKTFDKAHPDFVILAFAIRGVGTGELSIPREEYDPFLLMEILDKHQAGGAAS